MDKRWLCGWIAVSLVLLAAALVLAQARESIVGEWDWNCCKDAKAMPLKSPCACRL
jgi:hypothetical protein